MLLAYGKHIMDTDQVKSGIKHLFCLVLCHRFGIPTMPCSVHVDALVGIDWRQLWQG